MSDGHFESLIAGLGGVEQIANLELRSLVDAQATIVELITSNAPLEKTLTTIAVELEALWTESHAGVVATAELGGRATITAPTLPAALADALSSAHVPTLRAATNDLDPFEPFQYSATSSVLDWPEWSKAVVSSAFDSAWLSLVTPSDDPAPAWLVVVTRDATPLDAGSAALFRRFGHLCRLAIDQHRREVQLHRLIADERRRLAGIVHDDPIQALTAVGLRVQRLTRHVDGAAVEQVADLHTAVSKAIERMRRLLIDLHPPTLDDEGLVSAIDAYIGEVIEPLGIRCELKEIGNGEPALGTASLAYRLVTEALWNVVKHANASTVEVTVTIESGAVDICIVDDGDGFDSSHELRRRAGHMGLSACRELATRASGSWQVESVPGSGTTVRIWLPGPVLGDPDGRARV